MNALKEQGEIYTPRIYDVNGSLDGGYFVNEVRAKCTIKR
jgi:hypothetical protein